MHRSKGKLSGVLHKGFKPDKCKTSLRMAVARIKLLRNRKEVQVRQMRREVAQLLEANQDQTARIRVEHVIREEKFMQAYDLIEVYCELIVARLSIIDSQKTCPIDLKEAIASVIFASMRCADVTELADVRKHFTSKYGKEFAAAALEVRPDSGVNRLVIEKLSAGAPDVQTKIKTLSSIAEEHNIKWEPKAFEEKLQKPNEDLLQGAATYGGGSSTYSMSKPQPTYSGVNAATVDAATSHVPTGPYSPADVSANSAFSEENRRDSSATTVPSSFQHGAPTYSSTQIHGANNFSHGSPGGPSVSRPYSQYGASVPVSRNEEINQPRERNPSVSSANWNVEFKDATSAAQAAAESAEMASIAARAAAQLASRGNYSGKQNTGAFESAVYSHETAPRKQRAEQLVKDDESCFNDHGSGIDDPRVISSTARRHSGMNHVDSQDRSTAYTPAQGIHSYSPESHSYDYDMPTEPPHAYSPEPPRFDDLYERESNIGRSEVHPSVEKFQDNAFGGRDAKDVEIRQASSNEDSTNDHYDNYSSPQGTFIHGGSTIWDQNDKIRDNSTSIVFDQYDSDIEEDNVFDTLSSKHAETALPGTQDHMGFSTADWSQQHRSESPIEHRTSTLFSRTATQHSDNSEANRRDIPSPHSYDNLPPTFDSVDGGSDEEITTTMHAESLRSHARESAFSGLNQEANRVSGKLVPDVNESIEDYESKSWRSPGLNMSYKEKHDGRSGDFPRFDSSVPQSQRKFNRVQSSDSDLSDEETEPENLRAASSARANVNQSLPFSMQTSASDDKDKGDFGLNLERLTPGLRNKSRQPPPYTRENMLPEQSSHRASARIEESVDSEENTTSFEQTRNTPKSSRSTGTLVGGNYTSELYERNPSVETRREARSSVSRNSLNSDDNEKLSEQFGNTTPITPKSSEHANSSEGRPHEIPGIRAREEMRSRITRNYFDSDDSEEEVEQQQVPQPKWPGEQIQSRRTREVRSDTKRDGRVPTGAQYADETESMPKETKVTQAFNSSTEKRRDAPVYSRVPVQPSSRSMPVESSIARGKSQEAEMNRSSIPENEGNPETSAGTHKESTPKTPPAHVHPKLPTDYDSFAAHFMSLRTNRR